MLEPLNPTLFRALVEADVDTNYLFMNLAKRYFKKKIMDQGVLLFEHIGQFGGQLHVDRGHTSEDGIWSIDEWHIGFRVRLFKHLTVRPDPDREAFVKIYEDDKHLETYGMLGHPEQWQAMMFWIWNYGSDRLIRIVAFESRKKASRPPVKHELPFNPSSGNFGRKDPTKKRPPDTFLHRPLHSQNFKAQGSKSSGKIGPSNLGLASLTLTDMEEEVSKEQISHKSHPTGSAVVSVIEVAADGIAGSETTDNDVKNAGAG